METSHQEKENPMRCNRQWIVVVALAVGLLGGGMVFAQSMPKAGSVPGKGEMPVEQGKAGMGAVPGKAALININTADEAQLTSLKGIGPTKAKAITQYRQEHGPFKTVDDLKHVSGIGDKTLAALKPFITVGP
jgi:comEA protein